MAVSAAELMVTVGADTSPAEQAIQGFRGQLNQSAADLGRTGAYLTAAVSAPILGIGFDAIQTAGQFQQSMARVGAISRASESDLTLLTRAAEDLGRTTSFSASEAADGMSFLAMAGFEVSETIEAMPGLLSLAAAGQTDLATTADIASNVLSAMGWEASRTTELADIMTATFTRSNTSLEQLGGAMSYVAPTSANLGISMEQTAAAIGLLGDAGIQSTRAGTGLNAVLNRLGAPTDVAADAMENLGINVFDAAGNMQGLPQIIGQFERALDGMTDQQRTQALSQIFDTRALTSFSILLNEGSERLDEFASSMDTVAAADIAAMQMDTFEGSIKLLNSALEGLKITVGNAVLPALQDLVSRAGPMITRVTEWFESLDRSTQIAGFAFLGLAAAAGPVMLTLAGVAAGISFLLTPIGAVVAGTALLGAAFAADFAGMRTATMGVVDVLRNLVGGFQTAREAGLNPFESAIQGVWAALEGMGLQTAAQWVLDFNSTVQDAWRSVSEWVSNINNLPEPLQLFATRVQAGAQRLGDLVSHIRDVIANSDSFRDALVTLGRQGVDFLTGRLNVLFDRFDARLQPIRDGFERVSEIVSGVLAGDMEPARIALNEAFDAIASFDLPQFVSSLSTAGTEVSSAILNSFNELDLPTLRDNIISRLGLDNIQLFPDGDEAGIGNLPAQLGRVGIAFGAIGESISSFVADLPTMNEALGRAAIGVGAMREAAETFLNLDWATISVGATQLVSEVRTQLGDIDWSSAATGLRLRAQAAFTSINWGQLAPIDISPLIRDVRANFATAQQRLAAFMETDNPVSRFFERARAVIDFVALQMQGIGGLAPMERFDRAVSSVLATVNLVGETRHDIITTATRHIASFATALLTAGTDIVDGLDSEKIATTLANVATEWSDAFGAVFEDASLFDVASAAGSLGSSFVNKLGEILGAPEFGEDIGKAVGNMTVALTQGAQELVTGIVDGIGDTDWSKFSANFNTFATGFINGVSTSLEEANYSAIAGAIVTGISTWLAEQWRAGLGGPEADFESGTSLAAVTGSAGFEAGQQVRESILSAATDAADFALAQMNDFLWPDIPEPSDDFWPVIDSPASDFWPEPESPPSSWWPEILSPESSWWPDIPEITWPELPEITWPDIPEFSWPEFPEITWPTLPTIEWPELPAFTFPELPTFEWPSIPSSLLDWEFPLPQGLLLWQWPAETSVTQWNWPEPSDLLSWSFPSPTDLIAWAFPRPTALLSWAWPSPTALLNWQFPSPLALLSWSWPRLPTWTWPVIPTPPWLTALLNWRPTFGGGGGTDEGTSGTGASGGTGGGASRSLAFAFAPSPSNAAPVRAASAGAGAITVQFTGDVHIHNDMDVEQLAERVIRIVQQRR